MTNPNGCPFVHAAPQPNISIRCPYCDHVTPPAEPGTYVTLDGTDWKAEAMRWRAIAINLGSTPAPGQRPQGYRKGWRPCTCPADNRPVPCARRYALSDCLATLPTSAEPDDRAERVGDRSVHAEPISSLTHPETPESAEGGAS